MDCIHGIDPLLLLVKHSVDDKKQSKDTTEKYREEYFDSITHKKFVLWLWIPVGGALPLLLLVLHLMIVLSSRSGSSSSVKTRFNSVAT